MTGWSIDKRMRDLGLFQEQYNNYYHWRLVNFAFKAPYRYTHLFIYLLDGERSLAIATALHVERLFGTEFLSM